MSIEPFIAFFLIRYLKKCIKDSPQLAKWDQIFSYTTYAIISLFIIDAVLHNNLAIAWIWHALMLVVFWHVFNKEEFTPARPFIVAFVPLVILLIASDLVKTINIDLYHNIENYIGFAYPFAIVWLIAMWIIARKQKKALDKEREIRQQEEQQNKIVAARKAELEELVAARTSELTYQKEELEHALADLKTTQAQLIQKEKMASLGELTAGIAHEIQNPLNFVNNFSEVSVELVQELEKEVSEGNKEEMMAITSNIKQNLQKVVAHGKRADAIVKGMLQHSRVSSGQKEATDINALTDEYLRLSYHGLRAKDKSFNATIKTQFDEQIGKANVVSQDLGRVLLNLFNNAFYAVTDRRNNSVGAYEPTVFVTTKKAGNKIKICVRDNGMGIPQKAMDKIFQPFFTTKPTGEGTGLGLSLSYDIITKGHSGELKVDTREGEYTEFTVIIPAT